MNDKELTNKVVALGVGESALADAGEMLYRFDGGGSWQFDDTADEFVRDWRVAGALMEKCYDVHMFWDDVGFACVATSMPVGKHGEETFKRGSTDGYDRNDAPRAIIEACVEALAAVGDKP